MIRERRMPVPGEDLFRYYTSAGDFDKKISDCDEALWIAAGTEHPDFTLETGVVRSYIRLDRAIYNTAVAMASYEINILDVQERMREMLEELKSAGEENVLAVREWRLALGPEPWHSPVGSAVAANENTVREITEWITHRYLF